MPNYETLLEIFIFRMYELSKEGIIRFLQDKGGKCLNGELSGQFKVGVKKILRI